MVMPFVGRKTQIQALVSAVEAAELGESAVALVGGEPGIGKTRLVREVVARIASPVLWSSCWQGGGAPPYWPWQQLVGGLRAISDADRRAPAEDERDELRGLLGQAPAPDESGGARFRLFEAVVDLFTTAAQLAPLVLVLDDLHWSDEPSLRLLQFFARDPRARRIAIIGTYRDTDVEDDHPLAECLGDLARSGLHISLGGLGKRDVAVLAGALTGVPAPSPQGVSMLHRQTGGNPLFVRELVRLLAPEVTLETITDGSHAVAVPTSVRAVVVQRLARLSTSTQEVLAAASLVRPAFDVAILASVLERSLDEVLAAVDEAASARLLQRTGDGTDFAFTHALVREVLYDRLGLAVRTRLHARMAEALEDQGGQHRVPELAHHLLQAAVGGENRERAIVYAESAGTYNMQLLAYEEAATWFARALDVLRAERADDAREAHLLLELGEASLAAGDVARARDAYQRTADIARRHSDGVLLAKAALGLGAGFGGFEVRLLDPMQVQLLEEALDALGPEPSALRTWVLARLSVALSFLDSEARRRALSEDAVAMARRVGDPRALGYALAGHCDVIAGPDWCDVRRTEAEEVIRLGRETGDRQLELLGRRLRLVALLEVGDVGEADSEIERFAQVADGLRQPLYRWYVPLWRGMRALMRAELDEAARRRAEAEEFGARAHSDNATLLTFTQWWVQQRYESRFAEAGTAMADMLGQDVPSAAMTAGPRAIAAVQLGDQEKALALLQQGGSGQLFERTKEDSEWLPEAAQLAEAAVLLGAREEAEILYGQLRPYAHRFCVEGIGAAFTGSVAWCLAMLARFLGFDADAAAYEDQARAAHRRVGLVGDPPPLATPGTAPVRPHRPPPSDAASLLREGATWAVSYAGRTVHLRHSKGLGDVAVLLSRPEEDVHCLELMGAANVGAEAGPALDQQARRAYERRIRELQADIDDARDANDPARAERAEVELDALVQQLAEAFGLSGRSRTTGSAAERARSAVGWRVRAAIRHATEVYPALGRHLQTAIRTGTWCSYRPETAVRWEIDEAQGRRA
ncbi:MAG: AAA family ATPase [Actinomycetota bacterium]|nr:AAA family ATPase [Actinomycetota bacterium]